MNSTVFYNADSDAAPSPSQYTPEQIAQVHHILLINITFEKTDNWIILLKELTVLDQEHFSAIRANEFVSQAWSCSPTDAPNLVLFTKWFNRVHSFSSFPSSLIIFLLMLFVIS